MTDLAHAASRVPGDPPGPRADAFRAAGRHTARVRWLRRGILAGAILGSVLIVVLAFFNPFRTGIAGVSIDGVGLSGTKITMDHPRLTGFRKDGRPYELVAAYAVQDVKTPNLLELHDIDAHVTMADRSVVHVVSVKGFYDSSKETMQLQGDIHVTSDSGLDARLVSAFMEMKSGVMDSRDAVTVVMNTGTVSANSMHVGDNGSMVTFEGRVHTVVTPAATAEAAKADLKGTTQ